MNQKSFLKKIMLTFCAVILLAGVWLVLAHEIKNGQKTTELYPEVTDSPVYVECETGKPLEVLLQPTESFDAGALQILLVNISSESQGSFQVTIQDAEQNVLVKEVVPVNTIDPGAWYAVPASVSFLAGETYKVSFLADGSSPYFMKLPTIDDAGFPFTETVLQNGEATDAFLSMGINVVTPQKLTFGDVLYYSKLFAVLGFLVTLLLIWVGGKRVRNVLQRIPFKTFFEKYGNDAFLVLVFLFLSLQILVNAYIKGVYISSDSSGYLREAVNLVHGNGFAYDGMAGYSSWFANWPILYPAMIALVMLVTGTNAYLASKLLTILLIGILLIALRILMKKDAWMYSLCLLNLGFLQLAYYTWSEIPFILFLLLFTLSFGRVIESKEPTVKDYIFTGITGVCCFLTRYFGIYIWMIVGLYLVILLYQYLKTKDNLLLRKGIGITVTALIGGCLSIGYMVMNKLMNGMASGVSRSMWWDDYEILTNDLIESLLTEMTNALCIQIPQSLEALPFNMKVWVLLVLLLGIGLFVKKKIKWFSRESVLLSMGIGYYLIFIVIRYRSSMDSFYFRFFEPASFLICIALISLLLPTVKGKAGLHYAAGMISVFLLVIIASMIQNGDLNGKQPYYDKLTAQWDADYKDIPEKSVIIFDDSDFRSAYYRPDVISGTISPEDTLEALQSTYAGSEYLCIRKEYVNTMLEAGEYEESVVNLLQQMQQSGTEEQEYLSIALH